MLVSSAETLCAFNMGFDTVNLHCPTLTLAFLSSLYFLSFSCPSSLSNAPRCRGLHRSVLCTWIPLTRV